MFWGGLLLVLAFTWSGVFAEHRLAFPEDVRGGRIVSGWEASEGQFPYQLSLRMVSPIGAVFACGASVIHNEWAITAAHCTAQRVTILVRAGLVNLTRPAIIFETTEYYNHPLYIEALAGMVQPHDIGLIKFNRFIEYTDIIKPIRLQSSWDRKWNYAGIRLRAAGWGRTWTGGTSPEHLNWVFLTGVSNFDCLMAFGGSSIIVESTICARFYNVTSQSTCQGDSGGTLITKDYDGADTLVGVTSFVSSSGCHTGFPAGFIRPGHYHDWFTSVTGGINFDWDRQDSTSAAPTTENVSTTSTSTTTTPSPQTTEPTKPTTTSPQTTTEEWYTTSTTSQTITEPTKTTSAPQTTPEVIETTSVAPETTPKTTVTTTVGPQTTITTTTSGVTESTSTTTEEPESGESEESEESESEPESDSDSHSDSDSDDEDEVKRRD